MYFPRFNALVGTGFDREVVDGWCATGLLANNRSKEAWSKPTGAAPSREKRGLFTFEG
jgi:hypothetical protein